VGGWGAVKLCHENREGKEKAWPLQPAPNPTLKGILGTFNPPYSDAKRAAFTPQARVGDVEKFAKAHYI